MSSLITWKQNGTNPENMDNLTLISEWWEKLHLQEVLWQQRLIPINGNLDQIDWSGQRFDERLALQKPQIRGITLYWYKSTLDQELSTTVSQLTLNIITGELFVYPQSQPQLLIKITKPQLVYQTIEIHNPLSVGNTTGDKYILLLRDKEQQLQVKITLNEESLRQLRDNLPS